MKYCGVPESRRPKPRKKRPAEHLSASTSEDDSSEGEGDDGTSNTTVSPDVYVPSKRQRERSPNAAGEPRNQRNLRPRCASLSYEGME